MEKIWLLIFLFIPFYGHAQLKCFTPDEQKQLLIKLNKAEKCDSLIFQRDSTILDLSESVKKLDEKIDLKESQINLTTVYNESLKSELTGLKKDVKKLERQKKILSTSLILSVLAGVIFAIL